MRIFLVVLAVLLTSLLSGCETKDNQIEADHWEGIVTLGGNRYFMFLDRDDDTWKVSFPEMMLNNVPVDDFRYSGKKISFSVWLGPAEMRLELTNDGNGGFIGKALFSGTFGEVSLYAGQYSLIHRKTMQPERHGQSVSVDTPYGTLHGTLLLPEEDGPHPCVVMVAGSGPTDRDGNSQIMVENNNTLLQLAQFFQSIGFASLRYDKFGVGESLPPQGLPQEYTFDDAVADGLAWIRFIENNPAISSYGIVGHSEGSLIGLLMAKATHPAFFLSLAGNGDAIDRQLVTQVERIDPTAATILQQQLALLQDTGKIQEIDNPLVNSILPVDNLAYLRSWMRYNPVEVLESLTIPSLVVWGTNDERVSYEDSLASIQNEHSKFVSVQGMGHLLKRGDTPELLQQTYRDPLIPLYEPLCSLLEEYIGSLSREKTTGTIQ